MSRKIDSENPAWTKEDFKNAKPASELPSEILDAFPRTRGSQNAAKKVAISSNCKLRRLR